MEKGVEEKDRGGEEKGGGGMKGFNLNFRCIPRLTVVQNSQNRYVTSVPQLSLLSMWIQFNAAPKRIEPQKRAWSHLRAFEKIF